MAAQGSIAAPRANSGLHSEAGVAPARYFAAKVVARSLETRGEICQLRKACSEELASCPTRAVPTLASQDESLVQRKSGHHYLQELRVRSLTFVPHRFEGYVEGIGRVTGAKLLFCADIDVPITVVEKCLRLFYGDSFGFSQPQFPC
jgi:hypothetical protein